MQSSGDITVACIPPPLLGHMWPTVGPLLLRGTLEITGGDMRLALLDLLEQVRLAHLHRSQVWAVFDDSSRKCLAAMTTEIVDEADGKRVWVSRMSGERILAWGKLVAAQMIAFAKTEGAQAVRFDGRKALARAYGHDVKVIGKRPHGHVIFERAVQ